MECLRKESIELSKQVGSYITKNIQLNVPKEVNSK